jgi:hypothetical protein
MFFSVIDHYHDNEDDNIKNNNDDLVECFVCYEIKNEKNCVPIKLYKQQYYKKRCNCDGFIHKECLDKWFRTNKNCPICRNSIFENIDLDVSIVNNNRFGHVIFYFVLLKKITAPLFNYFSYLFFIVLVFKTYLSVMDKYYFLYNERQLLNDEPLLN